MAISLAIQAPTWLNITVFTLISPRKTLIVQRTLFTSLNVDPSHRSLVCIRSVLLAHRQPQALFSYRDFPIPNHLQEV